MAVPYNNERLVGATKARVSAAASPYVIAMAIGGIKVLPDIVNACLLVFVISSANTDIYVGARTLYSLAKDGHAPAIFLYTTEKGVPMYGVAATSVFVLLGYMNVSKSASSVFGYLVSLVTVFGALNWISVLTSYLGFRRGMKAQGIDRDQLPYRGPLQPYGAWYALGLTILIIIFNGKKPSCRGCFSFLLTCLLFAHRLQRLYAQIRPGHLCHLLHWHCRLPYQHIRMEVYQTHQARQGE